MQQVETLKVQLKMYTTKIANQEKYIGGFLILELIGEPDRFISDTPKNVVYEREQVVNKIGRAHV